MLSYCLKCKKDTESIIPRVSKTSYGKTMLSSKFVRCGSKNLDLLRNKKLVDY